MHRVRPPLGRVPLPRSLLAAALCVVCTVAAYAADATSSSDLRQRVLASDPATLERLGRHLIAGIDDMREVRRLIEARAIAGVFVTQKNLKGRTVGAIREEIAGLQALRRATGLPPLWIAADQEGGIVQRLSPPLRRQPPLSRIVAAHDMPIERKAAVRDYALAQGRALADIGVNVNFAPVVDLDFGIRNPNDAYTRIARRSLSRRALAVAEAAAWYCDGLRDAGVTCTRKHFPGLGRVFEDTHVKSADLDATIHDLANKDWLPFARSRSSEPGDWTMLGHVRLTSVDRDMPASASKAVVDILRRDLNVDGVVITDDFSMGAISKSKLGVGGAAVAALNAGVDLVLVSFSANQFYAAFDALITAETTGQLDAVALRESARRLDDDIRRRQPVPQRLIGRHQPDGRAAVQLP